MTGIERRVSVIVATPVGRPWDGRALASVLRNRDPRFEVWIADGRDREEARGKRDPVDPFPGALGKDPRVHLLRIPARSSATIHNETIARATGSILAITDDDCEVAPDWIGEMIAAFERDSRIGMVFGNVHPTDARRPDEVVPSYVRTVDFLARSPRDKSQVEGVWACMGLRRETWAELGGFDERFGRGGRFPGCADSDMAIRALATGWFVFETPRVSVTIHRAIPQEEHRRTVAAYTYASGALIGKHLRRRTPGTLGLVAGFASRWAGGGSHTAVGLGGRPQRSRRLFAFLCGVARGATAGARTRSF